jgi:hypothetical protein
MDGDRGEARAMVAGGVRDVPDVVIRPAVGVRRWTDDPSLTPLPEPQRQRTPWLLGYAQPDPTWVTFLPGAGDDMGIAVPARRLAADLGLDFQISLLRSRRFADQAWVFDVIAVRPEPVLLVHDELDTSDVPEVEDLLHDRGVPAVFTHPMENPAEWWNEWLARRGAGRDGRLTPERRPRADHRERVPFFDVPLPKVLAPAEPLDRVLLEARRHGHDPGPVQSIRRGPVVRHTVVCSRCGAVVSVEVEAGTGARWPGSHGGVMEACPGRTVQPDRG